MKTKTEKFPLTIKAGSVAVKIYREEKASGTYYRLGFYQGSKRKFEHYSTLEEAKTAADAKAKQLSRGDVDAAQLSGRDRLIYGRALEALRPWDVSLDGAALEYAEAKKILGGFKLSDAARFYMRHHGEGLISKSVKEAVSEMIEAKTTKGVSALYIADLRYRLGAFSEAFSCNLTTVAADDVRNWLGSIKLSARSYNNFLGTLGTFFAFAQSNGWLAKDADPLAKVEKRKEKSVPVEIFTPDELMRILTHASPKVIPCIALGAFAGLRSEEILRLEWSDLERRPGFVEVGADKAKTAQRRLVPISPNLARWLSLTAQREGHVWPLSKAYLFESFRNAMRAINKNAAKAVKLAWKKNALRHSFISYRLADVQDVNRVALESGNSAPIIFKNYRELATPDEASAWFNIAPKLEDKIVPMIAAA